MNHPHEQLKKPDKPDYTAGCGCSLVLAVIAAAACTAFLTHPSVFERLPHGVRSLLGTYGLLVPFSIAVIVAIVVMTIAVTQTKAAYEKDKAEYEQKKRLRKQAWAEEREAKRRKDQELNCERIRVEIIENISEAVTAVESMPVCISEAKRNAALAVEHYRDGAYSPFWSDIEQAYMQIANYRNAIDVVGEAAQTHAWKVFVLINNGGDPSPYMSFPVTLNGDEIDAVLNDAVQSLEEMAYQAQKDPVFAQIWEQRRTTAAIVAGFENLDSVVRGMGVAISRSIASMGQEIVSSNERIERAVSESAVSTRQGLVESSAEQVAIMRELSGRVNRVKREIVHQNWGRYPLLG